MPEIDENDEEVAEIFVVDDDVDRHRQRGDEQIVDQAEAEQRLEIERDLEPVVAVRGLRRDAREHRHAKQREDDARQRRKLRQEDHGVGTGVAS